MARVSIADGDRLVRHVGAFAVLPGIATSFMLRFPVKLAPVVRPICTRERRMQGRERRLHRSCDLHVAIAGALSRSGFACIAGAAVFLPGLWMPASFVRFNMSALMATTAELPDIESAAISGLSTNG